MRAALAAFLLAACAAAWFGAEGGWRWALVVTVLLGGVVAWCLLEMSGRELDRPVSWQDARKVIAGPLTTLAWALLVMLIMMAAISARGETLSPSAEGSVTMTLDEWREISTRAARLADEVEMLRAELEAEREAMAAAERYVAELESAIRAERADARRIIAAAAEVAEMRDRACHSGWSFGVGVTVGALAVEAFD